MRLATFALAIALLVALAPSVSHAGRAQPDDAFCSKPTVFNGETINGCYGTMKGFRDNPDPDAYAELTVRANGMISFQARLNGAYFLCYFEDSYDAQYFATVMSGFEHGRFVIGSRDGKCDMVGASFVTGSRYGSYDFH